MAEYILYHTQKSVCSRLPSLNVIRVFGGYTLPAETNNSILCQDFVCRYLILLHHVMRGPYKDFILNIILYD